MKVSILWASLASYSVALYRELVRASGCRIQLIYQPPNPNAPYQHFDLSFCESAIADTPETRGTLESRVSEFGPDLILMASWNYPHFMRIAKRMKKGGTFVLSGMDNQWSGSPRQWLGVLTSRQHLKPAISTFLVAGDRQAAFARKLGYDDVLYGLYAADVANFAGGRPVGERPRQFLFVGRLVKEKGVGQLLNAYSEYRKRSSDPWGLTVAGTGPLLEHVKAARGVNYVGFINPADLPNLFQQARCFVLPSLWEPWGVVLHEAAAAGLPLICTYPCGASTVFVRDGLNGAVIPPKGPAIAAALSEFSRKTDQELETMSSYGRVLAELWTPTLAARYVMSSVRARLQLSQTR